MAVGDVGHDDKGRGKTALSPEPCRIPPRWRKTSPILARFGYGVLAPTPDFGPRRKLIGFQRVRETIVLRLFDENDDEKKGGGAVLL